MTKAEALAFNAGVEAVLRQARRTVEAIKAIDMRPIRKELAVAALDELAEAGKALLLPISGEAS